MLSADVCRIARSAPVQRRRGGVRCFAAAQVSAPAAYKLNFNQAVDKAHEGKPIKDIIQLPPSALQGLSKRADTALAALNVKTVQQLGSWKLYKAAKAMAALAATEEAGGRPEGAACNINGLLDKQWEVAALGEVLAAPPSALQGLRPKSDEVLGELGIRSVQDLADWKYAAWADALVTLAEYERADFSSS